MKFDHSNLPNRNHIPIGKEIKTNIIFFFYILQTLLQIHQIDSTHTDLIHSSVRFNLGHKNKQI